MPNANNAFGVTLGINSGPNISPPPYGDWTSLFADMNALGLTWLRFQIPWRNQERTQGVYDFVSTDDAVARCNAAGINIMLTINDAPSFYLTTASQKASSEPFYLMDPTGAAAYATAYVGRYTNAGHGNIQAFGFNENANIHNTHTDDVVTLSGQITNAGGPYTQLSIAAATRQPASTPQGTLFCDTGTLLYLGGFGNTTDVATVSSPVTLGDTTVNISSFTPAVTYPVNTVANVAYISTFASQYPLYYPGTGGNTSSKRAQPTRDGHFAAPVFNALAPAVRAINPSLPLGLPLAWWTQPQNVGGVPNATVSNYTAFFQQQFTDITPGLIDANVFLDFHDYTNKIAPNVGNSQVSTTAQAMLDLAAVATANGHSNMPIWCTEFGWQVPQDAPDPTTQAAWYSLVLPTLIPPGNPNKNKAFFFTLLYGHPGNGSSLVLPDGSHQPAYQTVQSFIASNPSSLAKFGKFMAHA